MQIISSKKFFKLFSLVSVLLLVIFLNFFPNYYSFVKTPDDKSYSGHAALFDPQDINVYVAAINWSQKYGFYFQNAYTTQVHKPLLIYPLYTLSGVMFPNINPFLLFHVMTVLFGVLLFLVVLRLANIFISNFSKALGATFLILLGGGFGWLLLPKSIPADFTTPFTFTNTLQRPHEILALTFYLISLCLFYLGIKNRKLIFIATSSFFCLLFIPFYPYLLLSFYLICGVYALILTLRKNQKYPIYYLLISTAITLPIGIAYSFYLLSGSGFGNVLSPTLMKKTPNIISVILGYGILSFFVLYQLLQKKDNGTLFLTAWFFLSILLAYFPVALFRYFLRGLFFPVVILTLTSLDNISKKLRVSKSLLLTAIFALTPLTSFYLSFTRINTARKATSRWYYIAKEEKEALNYLSQNTPSASGVLASHTLGNYIPAYTENRVYYGHLHQTPNSGEKIVKLTNFYENKYSNGEAKSFLQANNISYIVWGQEEQALTLENSNEGKLKYSFLETIYKNSKVTIFSH